MKELAWQLPPGLKPGGNDQAGSHLTTTPEHAYWVMSSNNACRIERRGVFKNYNSNGLTIILSYHRLSVL